MTKQREDLSLITMERKIRYGVVGFVRDEGDGMLDERVQRAVRASAIGRASLVRPRVRSSRFLVVKVNAKSISVVLRVKHCGSDDGRVA